MLGRFVDDSIAENLKNRVKLIRSNFSKNKYSRGSGEYIEGGGVGGVFSLLIRGSMIVGRTTIEHSDPADEDQK